MIKIEAYIEESGGKAKVTLNPMTIKDKKPTPLEVAAWHEMCSRIFAKVVDPKRRKR